MYLYLGNGRYKKKEELIGIFDMDTATVSSVTRRFLSKKEKSGVLSSDGELPKSFILCQKKKELKEEKKEEEVILSKLASGVLFARTASRGIAVEEET